MKKQRITFYRMLTALAVVLSGLIVSAPCRAEEPSPAAVAAFNSYVGTVEKRLAEQHKSANGFLEFSAPAAQVEGRLRQGEMVIDHLTPETEANPPGAMLHHWRGSAFVPGAQASDFLNLMKNFNRYPQYYAPQVISARVISQEGEHLKTTMRVQQKHVITVVMDTDYDVNFHQVDAHEGYSISHSTQIREIEDAGTPKEHALSAEDQHGFLWRLNTYWTYREEDGGLYIQIESISLTRSVPAGLGWIIRPFIESVPRESLEFTLRHTSNVLHK